MNEEAVKYNGAIHPKAGFRTYVYDKNGIKKLVNSWDEYEAHVSTSTWFTSKPKPKPKRIRKKAGD